MTRFAVVLTSILAGAVVGCSAQTASGASPSEAREIKLTMVEPFGYDPVVVEVAQGESVRFVILNPTDTDHEVYIGVEAEQDAHEASHGGVVVRADVPHFGYGIYIVARGTGTLDYHFGTAGDVLIGCHLPGHYAAGHVARVHVAAAAPTSGE